MKRILIGLAVLSNMVFGLTNKQAEQYSKDYYKAYTGKELNIPIFFKDFDRTPMTDGRVRYTAGEYSRFTRIFENDVEYIVYDLKHIHSEMKCSDTDAIDTIAHEVSHKINSDNGYRGHGKEFQETNKKMLDIIYNR